MPAESGAGPAPRPSDSRGARRRRGCRSAVGSLLPRRGWPATLIACLSTPLPSPAAPCVACASPGRPPRARARRRFAIAAALAPRRPVEIVSVDSAQVYRGMDIGTAKPSPAERAARAAPPDRHRRAHRPLFGGALRRRREPARRRDRRPRRRCRCWSAAPCCTSRRCSTASTRCPPPMPPVRAEIEARRRERRLAGAARRAGARRPADRGPPVAQRCAAHPARARGPPRRAAGRSRPGTASGLAAIRRRCSRSSRASAPGCTRASRRASRRCWHAGLVDEVRGLRARGDLRADMPSMRAVGYRQAWAALDAGDLRRRSKRAAARPRASSPSASSPGCAACRARHVVACDAPSAHGRGRAVRRSAAASLIAEATPNDGPARDRLAGQALRRRARSSRLSTSPSSAASSSPSSANRASASRRCSTASPDSTASTPARSASPASTSRARRAGAGACFGATISASCSRRSTCCRTSRVAANVGLPLLLQGRGDDPRVCGAARSRRPRRLRARACRKRSPAASCSASRSPARWSIGRACCSPTSRPATSIRPPPTAS